MNGSACNAGSTDSTNSPHWFALRVRTRSEVLVGNTLQQKGFDCFTPTYRQSRTYTDRIKHSEVPLFPGYLFCRFAPQDTSKIITTPAVQKILSNGTTLTPITESEIESLKRAAAAASVLPNAHLTVGQRVRVQHGMFTGMEGFLISVKGKNRLVVSVDLIQSAISVELESHHLEPVSAVSIGR